MKNRKSNKATKSNKSNKRVVRAQKASEAKPVVGLSVCGFCRAAGRSGLSIEQVLAVLLHFKAEHGGHTAANQRRWGVKGKDRNGEKIEALTAEQRKAIEPIIANVKPVEKATKKAEPKVAKKSGKGVAAVESSKKEIAAAA